MRASAGRCGALLGALALAALAQEDSPQPGRLGWRYQVGQELRYELVEERYQGAHEETLLSITATEVHQQVLEVHPDGRAMLRVTLVRYRFEDELEQLDSRKLPADLDRTRDPALLLVGHQFTITTTARGGIQALEGVESLAEVVRAELEARRRDREAHDGGEPSVEPEERRLEALLRERLDPAALARLCPQRIALLPADPVVAGMTWTGPEDPGVPAPGSPRLRWRLVDVDQRGVARVSLGTSASATEGAGVTEAAEGLRGELSFQVNRGHLLRGEVETRRMTPLGVHLVRRTHTLLGAAAEPD